MSGVHEVGDIQVHEDLPFLRKEWRAQRIGWLVMGILVLLGLAGVLGSGFIAHAESGQRRTLAVSYDRIIRHGAPNELTVHIGSALQRDSVIRIGINRSFLESFNVTAIIPGPVRSSTSGALVYYEFARSAPQIHATIIFQLTPADYWRKHALVKAGPATVRFSQFILP